MKITLSKMLTLLLLLAVQLTLAQEKTISGTVVDNTGLPIPGVNILIKGTTTGTQTDFDGNYNVNANVGAILVFSYVGLKTQEITVADANVINVTMLEDAESLDEVIVTAVGIKRKPDEITTAYENLKADEINAANNPDAVQALAGKVSGLQINTINTGVTPNTQIRLRGTKSLSGDNAALIVIDNVISSATIFSNLDPDIIDNVTILKGPNGAALYGSRGGNGVIVVTTKKGTKEGGKVTVGVNSSVTFEDIAFLPQLQDRYGKGYWGEIDAIDQGSWGPEYDGSIQPVGLPFPTFTDFRDEVYEFKKENIRPFFDTGITLQNTVTVSGGDAEGYFTISGNKRQTEGIIPDDEYVKDFFNLNAGKTFGKLSVSGIARFIKERTDVVSAYSGGTLYGNLSQLPSDVDIETFSSGDNGDHWTAFGDSPYWIQNNSRRSTRQFTSDLTGEIAYQFNDNISSLIRANAVNSSYDFTDYTNAYNATFTITGDGRNIQSALQLQSGRSSRFYVDLINNFNYTLTDDIEMKSLLGVNFTERKTYFLDTQGNDLTIPGLYTASNISSGIQITDNRTISRQNAIFANVDLSYKDFLFLNITGRGEWNSVLESPTVDDTFFFYPSIGTSFIPTKAFPELKSDILHKAKVSAGYVRVGNVGALTPHRLFEIGVQGAGFPFAGGVNSFLSPTGTAVAGIKPEFVSTFEGNLNLEFLNRGGKPRITLDASASFYTNTDQILNTAVSSSSGATSSIVNIGKTETDAFEIDLGFTPIKTENFEWSGTIGFSTSRTTVVKVSDDSNSLPIFAGGLPNLYAIEGQEFPVIQGSAYQRDDQGRVIVDANGVPQSDPLRILGTTTPDYILNFATEVNYKGFRLAATADFRTGHSFYSPIFNNLTGQGRSFITAENGRGHFIFPNSTVQGTGTDNTTVLTGPSYGGPTQYAQYQSFVQSGDFTGVDENFVLDATAFKLREISLGYTVPAKYLEKTFIQGLSLGISGRNLLIVLPKENRRYNDPEIGQGLGGFGQTPPTKFYAMNINLTF